MPRIAKTHSSHGNFKYNHVSATCYNCHKQFQEYPSSYYKYKRHFCSMKCYGKYRKYIPIEEQNNYKGVRKRGQSKHIYYVRYKKRHPELIAHLKARYRARKRNAEGSHTLKEWENLKKKFNNRCAICKKRKKLTRDHIKPLSKGGSDYIKNIQPLCRNCNSKKHTKTNLII